MSGRKTTYTRISSSELRKLGEQAAKASSLGACLRALNLLKDRNAAALRTYQDRISAMDQNIANLRRQLTAKEEASRKEVHQVRERLLETIEESNARIQAIARRNEENIAAMRENFQSDLARTRTDLADAIESNNRRIEEAMNQNNRRIEEEIQEMNREVVSVKERMDEIESTIQAAAKDEEILCEMAEEYLRIARELADDTENNYRPELLLPGRLKPVREMIRQAAHDIEEAGRMHSGVAATARLTARQAAAASLQLHQEVMQAEQEWNLRYQAARQVVNAAAAQAEASRRLDISDEYGAASVDVDYWSDRDLGRIAARIRALEGSLESAEDLNIHQLDNIQAAGLQASREIEDTTVFAAEAFYGSQDRADIAADISESMEQILGLQVVGYGYNGEDQRAAHRLHLKNPATGFEMVVTQIPERDGQGRIVNHLESDILNYGTSSEEDGDSVALDALEALGELGFEQSPVQTEAGFEKRPSDRIQCADMQAWEKEKAPQIPKPVHHTLQASH